MRLIDGDALIEEIKKDIEEDGLQEKMVFYRINEAPTIEPCEDAISREDVIRAIWAEESDDGMVFEAKSHIDRDIRLIPSVAPSRPSGEWIPCSERLPEEYGNYLVSIEDMVRACYYQRDGWDYYEPDAWQPLPKPWKGADDE